MDYDKILTSAPINKTTAMVTKQPYYEETERDKVKDELKNLEAFLIRAKKTRSLSKEEYKKYGRKKLELQNRLSELKDKKKNLDPNRTPIEFYFIEVCQEEMHKLEFRRLLSLACKKRDDQTTSNRDTKGD